MAAQEALQPVFVPILVTGTLLFAAGVLGFIRGVARGGILGRGATSLVVTALGVLAAARFVALGAVQFQLQAAAGLAALWPLAYRMWRGCGQRQQGPQPEVCEVAEPAGESPVSPGEPSPRLVKLVIEEHGSDDAAWLWDGADAVVTSRVAHPEVRAALAAAHRDARLDATAHQQAKAEWDAFHQALRMVELTSQLERDAADLAEQHALSGFDAVHLASALTLAQLPRIVATWDTHLLRAAQSSGLDTLPAQL